MNTDRVETNNVEPEDKAAHIPMNMDMRCHIESIKACLDMAISLQDKKAIKYLSFSLKLANQHLDNSNVNKAVVHIIEECEELATTHKLEHSRMELKDGTCLHGKSLYQECEDCKSKTPF